MTACLPFGSLPPSWMYIITTSPTITTSHHRQSRHHHHRSISLAKRNVKSQLWNEQPATRTSKIHHPSEFFSFSLLLSARRAARGLHERTAALRVSFFPFPNTFERGLRRERSSWRNMVGGFGTTTWFCGRKKVCVCVLGMGRRMRHFVIWWIVRSVGFLLLITNRAAIALPPSFPFSRIFSSGPARMRYGVDDVALSLHAGPAWRFLSWLPVAVYGGSGFLGRNQIGSSPAGRSQLC